MIQLKCIEKTKMIDKVQNVIILCLRDKVLREVAKEKTPATMWTKLELVYLAKSLDHRLCLKQQLYSFKMVESKSLVEQPTQLNKFIDDIKILK